MDTSIPQNVSQFTFDFDALSDQPVDDVVLLISAFPSQKQKFCSGCKQWFSIDHFGKQSSSKDGLRRICKSCRHDEYLEHSKEIIQKHRETFLAKSSDEQRAIRVLQNRQYRERALKKRQDGMCSKCLARPAESGFLCKRCQAYQEQYGNELRDQVIAAYGGKCAFCSESHPAFLSVDHINNDGAEHRRITGGGHRLYLWLRKNGFPREGFQLLCSNCNWRKHVGRQSSEKTHIMIWHDNLRRETLTAYRGKCVCCGESHADILTIDHVNNDGNDHRRQVGTGSAFYSWLRKQGFPQDGRFQVLCFNCNRAKYYYGVCPHQQ